MQPSLTTRPSDEVNDRVARRLETASTPLGVLALSALERGGALALRYVPDVDGPATEDWTFDRTRRAAESLATTLRRSGIGPGDAVAILLPACPEGLIAFVGASAVGIALPLNGLLNEDAIAAQMRLADVRALIVSDLDGAAATRIAAALEGLPELLCVVGLQHTATLLFRAANSLTWAAAIASEAELAEESDPNRVGALFHTGGTTGAPKLAQLTLRNIAAGAHMAAGTTGYRTDDALLVGLPLFHVGGAICCTLAALSAGASVTFVTAAGPRNPAVIAGIWRLIERLRISILVFVPTSLGAIEGVPLDGADLSTLRCLQTGASSFPADLGRRMERKTGAAIANVYGMTELAGIGTGQPLDGVRREPGVGYAAPLLDFWLEDGEVMFRGPNAFAGYRTSHGTQDQPVDATVASGDLGMMLPDGQLRIIGRRKDVIIRSGHNIDPAAIEEIALAHPMVASAAAVGMPNAYAGEVPVLYLVLRKASVDLEEILAWIAERVMEPPARPRRAFILDALPLTDVGKVARFRLRQWATTAAAREAVGTGNEVTCVDPSARAVDVKWGEDANREGAMRALADLGLTTSST